MGSPFLLDDSERGHEVWKEGNESKKGHLQVVKSKVNSPNFHDL